MLAEAAEWLLQAEDAFKAADAMYLTRRYLYAMLMCQLAIEKGLKAVVVARTAGWHPRLITSLTWQNSGRSSLPKSRGSL